MAQPKDFAKVYPYDSVFHNSEREHVARNIMVILGRTGNTFRELSWEEYLQERIKDGGGDTYNWEHGSESQLFPQVVKYTHSEEMARKFSPEWAKV